MLGWLEDFIKSGVEEGRFSENRLTRICRLPPGMPLPATYLDDYITTTALRMDEDSEKNATAALPGTTGILWR